MESAKTPHINDQRVQVLVYYAKGWSGQRIGDELGITKTTRDAAFFGIWEFVEGRAQKFVSLPNVISMFRMLFNEGKPTTEIIEEMMRRFELARLSYQNSRLPKKARSAASVSI